MNVTPIPLPEKFVHTIRSCFSKQGEEWLEWLPQTLRETAERWSLEILPPVPNLSFNYVAPVLCADGSTAVLKVSVLHPEFYTEIDALRHYNGHGSVRLLQADRERGVFLLERLSPGTTLTTLANDTDDEKATSIVAEVMRRLWREVAEPHSFPKVEDWHKDLEELRKEFNGGTGIFPTALVEEAETLSLELFASAAPSVLLHGDLHHDNILSGRGTWLAIDPKGILGEPAYEVGAMLRNLWQDRHTLSNPQQLLTHRVHQLSEELGIERKRIRDWAVVQALLSAWWCYPEEKDVLEGIATMQLLVNIRA
ncbi:MAG: phosphotransferase [Armatimonadetes bacterium]|nr:phosphotransferase [Armatimonadota bacterium]